MTVIVQRHGARAEIVRKPDLVPGTIGWKAGLLAMGLFAGLCRKPPDRI